VRLLAVTLLAAALAAPASAGGYSFGRLGGNIIPFTVTIDAQGATHASGPVHVGRSKLTAAQLAAVAKAAAAARFASLPATTLCPGTLPDVAATFVVAGGHRVTVHGGCSARYATVWNALTAAVRLTY